MQQGCAGERINALLGVLFPALGRLCSLFLLCHMSSCPWGHSPIGGDSEVTPWLPTPLLCASCVFSRSRSCVSTRVPFSSFVTLPNNDDMLMLGAVAHLLIGQTSHVPAMDTRNCWHIQQNSVSSPGAACGRCVVLLRICCMHTGSVLSPFREWQAGFHMECWKVQC